MRQDRGAILTSLGIGAGAGLMYFLDPVGGRRRRALFRDRVVHASHVLSDATGAAGRDMSHRAAGMAARIRGAGQEAVDDRVLEERVRAQLGRVCSHPRAIEVSASEGMITLRGPILEAEANRVCRAIERVNGVRGIWDELQVHTEPGNIPALQGGSTPRPFWQRSWSPTARACTALAATAGIGLLARAAVNRNG
jgi:BON domain